MRIIITLLLFFLLHGFIANAQIGEVEKHQEPILIGYGRNMEKNPSLEYYPETDVYVLTYANLEYPNINEYNHIRFKATKAQLESLYQFFMDGFDTKELSSITVGDDIITIGKSAMSLNISVDHKEGLDGWFYLSNKQVQRLFGKIK